MKKILITLLCLPFIMFAQNSDKKSSQEEFPTIEIKDEMPNMDYEMKSVNGISYSLNNLKEKNGIIILFTCNTCPFVVKWEDRYKLLEELAKKNNIGLVYINSNYKKRDGDDSYEEMKKHAKKMNYRFPYLLDEKSKLANSFGAKTTPHIFMFNSNLQLAYKGAIDDNYEDINKVKEFYLEDAIQQLVKGKRIKVSETKPVGCSIKRFRE
jgi:thioredoxin-related protein|tara:strand:- start:1903 stop:2532 length:630 start_codon:yes stop_codon:yes gene_type:complete